MKHRILLTLIIATGCSYASDNLLPPEILYSIIHPKNILPVLMQLNTQLRTEGITHFRSLSSQQNILTQIHTSVRFSDYAYIQCMITHNTCFDPNNITDSGRIGAVINLVINQKDSPVEAIISKRYPHAYSDYLQNTHQATQLNLDFIQKRFKNGTIIISAVHSFLTSHNLAIHDVHTQEKSPEKPEYALIVLMLQWGFNPNYTGGVFTHSGSAVTLIARMKPCTTKEKLTSLITQYQRSPQNTTDPFYVNTRGYRYCQ